VTPEPFVLLTGATGYVGGRLLRELQRAGVRVRCLARRPEFLRHVLNERTELVRADVLDAGSLGPAFEGVHTAYYLVHSMGSPASFEETDRCAAERFGAAARTAGVRRIIYLGGLGDPQAELSPHLRSRQEVGHMLRASGVPVVELRASIVIGSGSLSFEMIRALVERLPVMIMPRWVSVLAQPIGITDLLKYLVEARDLSGDESRVFEIGGADRVSYGDIMREYARQRGLRRLMIPVPVLTPRLSSLWLGLVTPLYARVGRKLIDSIRHPTVVRDDGALRAFAVRPQGIREAIGAALRNEDETIAATRWSNALSAAGEPRAWGGVRFGNRLVDSRLLHVAATPQEAFAPIRRLGGTTGYYYGDWLWRMRGYLDVLAGGVGLRRGRRDPETVQVGDAVDFWRVAAVEPDRRLFLEAEMKLPGRAWLEYEVVPREGGAAIRQTAIFDPIGLAGIAYWYGIHPLHRLVFEGTLRGVAAAAEAEHRRVGLAARDAADHETFAVSDRRA
jgi:uncharacterized protein YbjT (DUF2867 family)